MARHMLSPGRHYTLAQAATLPFVQDVEPIVSLPLEAIGMHPLFAIRRGWEPESDPQLDALARSLTGPTGVIHPIIVAPLKDPAVFGSRPWTLIAGRRRLEAARRAGLPTIPARIKAVTSLDDPYGRLVLYSTAVQENVERRELALAERREALWQLKQFYEAVYPPALTQGRRRYDDFEDRPPSFTTWASRVLQMPARTIRRDVRLAVLVMKASAAEADQPTYGTGTEQAPTPAREHCLSADAPLGTQVQQAAASGQNLTSALEALVADLTAADVRGLAGAERLALQKMLRALQTTITHLLAALAPEAD